MNDVQLYGVRDNFEFGDSPFVATSDEGELIGSFYYSINVDNNEGMLKIVEGE